MAQAQHAEPVKYQVGFYSPYIPKHFGGGEKHLFDVALVIAQQHEVEIAVPGLNNSNEAEIRAQYENFLGYSLDALHFVPTPLGTDEFFLSKLIWTNRYDYLYYVTDGSLFFSMATHNNLHIQVPFTDTKSFIERKKLEQWQTKNCNSYFTKYQVEKYWKTPITHVVHPMVNRSEFAHTGAKQKTIISIGRFFKSLHSKRQDVLITVFARLLELYPEQMAGYTLQLIGSVEDEQFFSDLQSEAAGLPIQFITGCSRKELVQHLVVADIYWHAAGFGVDENSDPSKVEHFGIATVEAMAAGCVPLVVGKGGQKEILGEELEWCQWQTIEECVEKTISLLTHRQETEQLRALAFERTARYDKPAFEESVKKMFAAAWQGKQA